MKNLEINSQKLFTRVLLNVNHDVNVWAAKKGRLNPGAVTGEDRD